MQIVVVGYFLCKSRQTLIRERSDKVAKRDVRIGVEGDVDPPIGRPHRALPAQLRPSGPEVDIGELGAEGQGQRRAAHAILDRLGTEGTHVDAHVKGVVHGEDPLGEHGGHYGHLELFGEAQQVALGTGAE